MSRLAGIILPRTATRLIGGVGVGSDISAVTNNNNNVVRRAWLCSSSSSSSSSFPITSSVFHRGQEQRLTTPIKSFQGPSLLSSNNNNMSTLSPIESSKRLAARTAVDKHVGDGDVVGVGSGSTIVYAVERLTERVRQEGIKVKCIPTSFQARQLILSNDLPLSSLESQPRCTVTIDGCDEADDDLTLIKGGGGCLAQEKVVAFYSDLFVVIADSRKNSRKLGQSWKYVPVEVLPLAYVPVKAAIEKTFGGRADLRMAKAKAGPVVTDNGNLLLDWHFPEGNQDSHPWDQVARGLNGLAGVVDSGLFVGMASVAYFGQEDGSVKEVTPEHKG